MTILGLCGFIAVLFCVVGGISWGAGCDMGVRWLARFGKALVALGVTAWVWVPWAAYGAREAWAWNTGQINRLERGPTVIPEEPEVIDMNEEGGQ